MKKQNFKLCQIYIEPELWQLLRKKSIKNGCKKHPNIGSSSESARRYIKKILLIENKNLINYEKDKIDWNEAYGS